MTSPIRKDELCWIAAPGYSTNQHFVTTREYIPTGTYIAGPEGPGMTRGPAWWVESKTPLSPFQIGWEYLGPYLTRFAVRECFLRPIRGGEDPAPAREVSEPRESSLPSTTAPERMVSLETAARSVCQHRTRREEVAL